LLITIGLIAGCGTSSKYKAPKILFDGELEYPLSAQLEKIEGEVLVGIFVSKEGKPLEVNILRSSANADLDSAAIEFSRRVNYKPAIFNGKTVSSWTRLELRYKLQKVGFDEPAWKYNVGRLQSQISTESDSVKRKIYLQRLYFKYIGLVDYVNKNDDIQINRTIKAVISKPIANQWNEFWGILPIPFVLLDDMLYRYPECHFKLRLKEDMIQQIVDVEYKIRMKALKSSRFNRKSIGFLDALSTKLEELQKP